VIDSSGSAGGNSVTGCLTPVQETQDPDPDLKLLAFNMLKQAVIDIPDRRWRTQALLWINDHHPAAIGWITSFETMCELLSRDVERTRALLNRFAETGLTMERIRNGYRLPQPGKRRKRRP
jgi:hypothetical protein